MQLLATKFKVDGVFEKEIDVNRVKEFMEVVYKIQRNPWRMRGEKWDVNCSAMDIDGTAVRR